MKPEIEHNDAGLYIRLQSADIDRTTIVNQWPYVAIDLDIEGRAVGVEILYNIADGKLIEEYRKVFDKIVPETPEPADKTRAELDKSCEEFSRRLRTDYYVMTGRDYDQDFAAQPLPEISAEDVRKWLIDNDKRMRGKVGREYHYSVMDVEEAIAAIKQERATKKD